MFRTPVLKTLYDKRWVILAWSIAAFAMNLLITWIFPDFKNPQLVEVFKSLPESLQAFSGSLDIGTIDKYLDSQVFFNNGSFIFWILGISIGVNLLSTDEDKGTLETTLATKISKNRLYTEKFIAMILIFLAVNIASTIGIWLGLVVISEPVSAVRIVQATVMLFIYTCMLGSFSFGVGALSGKKNLSIGIPTLTLVVMFLVYTFAQTVDWMKNWDKFTWNYYYSQGQTVINGISYRDFAVLISFVVLFFVIGLIFFNKRDLRK
jgi:ABC-type transport system involved in multi-copper enzyme maturation permease subunit